jgi:hypothetical protein
MILEDPIMTDMILPKALSAINAFSALELELDPNTAWKKRLAVSWVDPLTSSFGTVDYFVNIDSSTQSRKHHLPAAK